MQSNNEKLNDKLLYKKKILISIDGQFHFIEEIIDELKKIYCVIIDIWNNNNNDQKLIWLNQVDIIFCEWCGNNAIWYSNNKKSNQQLIIRLHRWELFAKHFFLTNWNMVNYIIFISPYIQNEAIYRYSQFYNLNESNFDNQYYINNNIGFFEKHEVLNGWKHFIDFNKKTYGKIPHFKSLENNSIDMNFKNKTKFIPNYIKQSILVNIEKNKNIQFNLGMVGYIPKLKRADIAIEILNYLVKKNYNYKLFIIGNNLQDIYWLKKNQSEIDYYNNLHVLIKKYNLEKNVIFNNYDDNIHLWFKNISFILGTSDIEGCHHSLAEGMSCGTIPFLYGNALNYYKLNLIYPTEFCFFDNDFTNLCEKIIELSHNDNLRSYISSKCILYAKKKFDFNDIFNQIKLLFE